MRTDTCDLQVVLDIRLCAWCKIRLSALDAFPVWRRYRQYHPACADAAELARERDLTRVISAVAV